jgi:pyruvate/2-oxoglutarate dehydrogenase complex dihydrolipoamide acyltransferase (E2) component
MKTLGEDLVLLSIRPDNGTIATKSRLGFGLRGSELVRLAASGRVGITGDRIVVLDDGPTGDERLDAALASLAGARRPPRPKTWVGHPGSKIVDAYLARLAAAGAIRQDRRTLLGFIPALRWQIADTARLAGTRARLDTIVYAGGPVDTAQAAFAGLASASGLGPVLYPGMANRQLRKRLEQIAKGELTRPATQAGQAAQAATEASVDAAARAAARAATDAATSAATDSATQAATQAATHAAVSAAVHAAHHAASDAGAHGGGHGGAGGGHH